MIYANYYPERPDGYSYWNEELIFESFQKWMKRKYNIDILKNEKYCVVIADLIYSILSAKEGELTVLPAAMGIGKSSLLFVFAKLMAMHYPNFGCIIVKERIEDIRRIEQQLGFVDDEYDDKKICFAWEGFNPESCLEGHKNYMVGICSKCKNKECEVKNAIRIQSNYPVVAISHERLSFLSKSQEMQNKLKYWKNSKGEICERKYIFIDERPKFFKTYSGYWSEFDTFIKSLGSVGEIIGLELNTRMIESAGGHLFYNIIDRQARLTKDIRLYSKYELLEEIEKVKDVWWKYHPENVKTLYPLFYNLFANGGYRSGDKLTTYQYTDYIFPDFKTVVLDGTASGDITYPQNSEVVELEDIRDYSNLTVHHYSGKNLSKTKIRSNIEKHLLSLVNDIEQISLTGKTLVVVSKEFEGVLDNELKHIPNVEIGHFNALKGTNKYSDCANIIFAGTMDFGDDYYILKAMAIDNNKVNSFGVRIDDMQRTFTCEFINEVKRNTNIRYMLQDIFRISIRNPMDKCGDNHVYLFNTNNEIVRELVNWLPGCKLEYWKPKSELERKSPNQDRLLEEIDIYITNIGDSLGKKELREAIGMKDVKEFQRLLRHYFISQELAKRGITGWEDGNRVRQLTKIQ